MISFLLIGIAPALLDRFNTVSSHALHFPARSSPSHALFPSHLLFSPLRRLPVLTSTRSYTMDALNPFDPQSIARHSFAQTPGQRLQREQE